VDGLNEEQKDKTGSVEKQKQVVFITSRVHPGETGASWIMHGIMDTLLNPKNPEEEKLVE
jgi:hypothetical protein